MYTLYYLNRNLQLGTIKADSLDVPILVPEDLIFCDLRKDINFIKEPHKCIDFTDVERLIIQSQFNDVSLIKEGDYRKQNTYLKPLCPIDYVPPVLMNLYFDAGKLSFTVGDFGHLLVDKFKIAYGDNGIYEFEKLLSATLADWNNEITDYLVINEGTSCYIDKWAKMAGNFKLLDLQGNLVSNIVTVLPS